MYVAHGEERKDNDDAREHNRYYYRVVFERQ